MRKLINRGDVHNDTLTGAENHWFTYRQRQLCCPGETVSGAPYHSTSDISGAYPTGYIWSYDGPPAGGTGGHRLALKWNRAFTPIKILVNPVTVTRYHINNDDVEWGPVSSSSLHETDG